MWSRIRIRIALVLVGLAFTTPVVSQTTNGEGDGGFCGDVYLYCPLLEHQWYFTGGGERTGTVDHGCQANGYHGTCSNFGNEVLAAFTAIKDAAKVGSAERMLKLAIDAPDYVVVNRERGTIMLLSCTRSSFIANIPYKESKSVLALASMLETLQKERSRYAALLTPLAMVGTF